MDKSVAQIHCPVCATVIKEEPRLCERCETPHHQDCWDYAGGCALFGCRPGKRAIVRNESVDLIASMNKWMWAYRAYSKCFTMTACTLSLVYLLGVSMVLISGFFPTNFLALSLLFILSTVHSFLFLAWFISAMGMAVFIVPALLARRRVNAILQCNLQSTGVMTRGVLDRLDVKGMSGRLLSCFAPYKRYLDALVIAAWVIFILFIPTFIFLRPVNLITKAIIPLFVSSVFFVVWPLSAVCERLAYFSTVQNRAAASFKGIKLVQ